MDKSTLEKRFETLPADVKAAITSPEIANKIQEIAQNHKLHLDQAGILEEEISLVMLGINHPDNFVNKIEERLGLPTEEAVGLAVDVNDEVFMSIRESLMKMHGEDQDAGEEIHNGPAEAPVETAEFASKDDILKEIENPTPVRKPISIADQTIAGPATSREVIPEPAPMPEAAKQEVAKDFIGSKLAEGVNIPAQKTVIEPQKPKNYSVDPYREPLA